ncbi:MAG: FIST C-terminal domain-containing protein [Bacteroidetes bacterium]|nr:FIST C-terminal domain-containing protein [Bacteroidota bacterium]
MYSNNLSSLKETLAALEKDLTVQSAFIFIADKNQPDKAEVELALTYFSKPLIGGIFPEIIADGERRETGFLVVPLHYRLNTTLINLKLETREIQEVIESYASKLSAQNEGLFCFVDALAPKKSAMLDLLYDSCGPDVNYVGGGAGSLSFKSFPCIIHQHNIYENAAVIGAMGADISVGVAHGWTPVSEPIKVTEVQGNSIISLDWKPAFDVYKDQIKLHSGVEINQVNFFDVAKSYPLGLVRLDAEMTIRDPYATDNGWLHIVDHVPEGEYVRIMNGNMESLLEGASAALLNAQIDLSGEATEQFCVDCISRVLYMQQEFNRELNLLNADEAMNGVLSIGEIANPGDTVLELFNKTIVVAKWKKTN